MENEEPGCFVCFEPSPWANDAMALWQYWLLPKGEYKLPVRHTWHAFQFEAEARALVEATNVSSDTPVPVCDIDIFIRSFYRRVLNLLDINHISKVIGVSPKVRGNFTLTLASLLLIKPSTVNKLALEVVKGNNTLSAFANGCGRVASIVHTYAETSRCKIGANSMQCLSAKCMLGYTCILRICPMFASIGRVRHWLRAELSNLDEDKMLRDCQCNDNYLWRRPRRGNPPEMCLLRWVSAQRYETRLSLKCCEGELSL